MNSTKAREKHEHDILISKIGAEVVRSHFALTPQCFYAWRVRGIPVFKRAEFARLAAVHGVGIPGDFFDKFGLGVGVAA